MPLSTSSTANYTANGYMLRLAFIISLGGFLFGFDASVISGTIRFIATEFELGDLQLGWVVSSLTFTSTVAMIFSGVISDRIGRKKILIAIAIMYVFSAFFSAFAPSYGTLVAARMLGGFAVGATLIIAPMYIAELSPPEVRGRMVAINQLNIVLGFSAAYFSNYYLLTLSNSDAAWVAQWGLEQETWRWMLGVEMVPALLYMSALFLIPESPRWLMLKGREAEAREVLQAINQDEATTRRELEAVEQSLAETATQPRAKWRSLLKPGLRMVLVIGLVVGVLQQITGVNAIFFYAPFIFEQSGIGSNAAFSQAIWIGIINVGATLLAMALIDRVGRKPLLVVGLSGIAISLFITAYGFSQATYSLDQEALDALPVEVERESLLPLLDRPFEDDLAFKQSLKSALGRTAYTAHEASLIQAAADINPTLILVGILGFVAFFAVSLGPVMWVLFSELFPNYLRALAVSFVGFVNSVVSFSVQQFFPWELANFGNALTFLIFGLFAVIGLVLVIRLLPETKGKSLEELEQILTY